MNKEKYLKSIPTRLLESWRSEAEAGNGMYAAYDHKNLRSMLFTLEAISKEISTREDARVDTGRKKSKKRAT